MTSDRIPPLREFLCSDSETRELLRALREFVLAGAAEDRARVTRGLRRFGYRVRGVAAGRDADRASDGEVLPTIETIDGAVDVLVIASPLPGVELEALTDAAAARGVQVLWLARGVGDPALAWRGNLAGLRVVFHRDPIEEYEMHFDDEELGFVAPSAAGGSS